MDQLLNYYKELSSSLTKFQSKSNLSSRCNWIRLTLLSFLRSDIQLVTYDEEVLNQGVSILSRFWLNLLNELFKNWNSISFVDKTCYLECISRLISRDEFILIKNKEIFKDLLILTLSLIFKKLFNLKILSINLNAFIGKVFAYSFIYLPNLSDILLFTLFIKVDTVNELIQSLPKDTNTSSFPTHLNHLINFKGNNSFNNCMKPPRHSSFIIQFIDEEFKNDYFESFDCYDELVIDLKDSNWVKKWASFDSDVFKSFLNHYLNISMNYSHDLKLSSFIRNQPGGILIYSHVIEIFNSNFKMLKNFKKVSNSEKLNIEMIYSSNLNKNYQIFLSNLSFLKFFKIIKNLIYNLNFNKDLILNYFENILIMKSQKISSYNSQECEIMYDFYLKFCLNLNPELFSSLNWEFWMIGLIKMIKTKNMVCIIKSISSIFNLWEFLPVDYKIGKNTIIFEVSKFLVLNWDFLFFNWQSLIRHFYYRLIIFKVLKYGYFNDIIYKKLIKIYLIFNKNLLNSSVNKKLINFETLPSMPIFNKKLIITYNYNETISLHSTEFNSIKKNPSYINVLEKSHNLETPSIITNKKVYSFDIFDDAIYSSTSTDNLSPLKKNPSYELKKSSSSSTLKKSINTAMSFFKKGDEGPTTPPMKAVSKFEDSPDNFLSVPKFRNRQLSSSSRVSSSTSLISMVSTSNSPSGLLNMDSIPTPPELVNRVPEDLKYKYKYQLIFSNESFQIQFYNSKLKEGNKFFKIDEIVEDVIVQEPKFPMNLMSIEYEDEDIKVSQDLGWVNYGKYLNEWNLVIDEYEEYMKIYIEEEWIQDPMMNCDIPPIKNMFGE